MNIKKIIMPFFIIAFVQLFPQKIKIINEPIVLKESVKGYSLLNYNVEKGSLNMLDSLYTLHIHSDSTMLFSWLLNKNGDDYFVAGEPNDHYYQVANGRYSIVVNFRRKNPSKEVFYYDKIEVDSITRVNIDKSACNKKQSLNIINKEQQLLKYSEILLIFSKNNSIRFVKEDVNYPKAFSNFSVRYNKLPTDSLFFGYRIVSKPNSFQKDYYYISGKFQNSDSSMIITNNINNLMSANLSFYFPTTMIPVNYDITLNFFPPGHFLLDDPILNFPLTVSVYQDTTFSSVLKWANFYNRVDLGNNKFGDLMTIQLQIGGEKVFGKLISNSNIKIPLSENKNVILGLTPTYWYGKFRNLKDTIKINGKWGWYYFNDEEFNQLFVSQTNDAILQYPLSIIIKDEVSGSVIVKKEISLPLHNDEINIGRGYQLKDLSFKVPVSKYEITVTNDKNEISGIPSIITAKAGCDLRKEDKNPPGLNSFQIVSGSSLSHSLKSNNVNVIRFYPVDNVGISSMELFYKEESENEWHSLDIEVMDEHYYKAALPELWIGTFSLKLVLSDTTGNTLEMRQEPAFVYSAPDGVEIEEKFNPEEFNLSEGYPNPFNMEINFEYNIPANVNSEIEIGIYNILGEKIITLLKRKVSPGKHKIKWDGKNTDHLIMPSGIYLLKINSMHKSITKKLMLIK